MDLWPDLIRNFGRKIIFCLILPASFVNTWCNFVFRKHGKKVSRYRTGDKVVGENLFPSRKTRGALKTKKQTNFRDFLDLRSRRSLSRDHINGILRNLALGSATKMLPQRLICCQLRVECSSEAARMRDALKRFFSNLKTHIFDFLMTQLRREFMGWKH